MHKYIGFKPGARPKCRDIGEISAFGTGSRLEIKIFVYFPLSKPSINNINNIDDINDIDNINNVNNTNNIGLEPQKPSQMQRSR